MREMIRKAFKFRLNPNSEQSQKMVEFSGANRFVRNKALAMNLFRLKLHAKCPFESNKVTASLITKNPE